MKKLKVLLLLFCLFLSLPLGFVIWQTYGGLKHEEHTQMRFFAQTLFDQMEDDLARLIQQEEGRAVDEYGYFLAGTDRTGIHPGKISPLAQPGYPDYILGYLQNNPDGSFQTPLVADMGRVPEGLRPRVAELKRANLLFNKKKMSSEKTVIQPTVSKQVADRPERRKASLAERYLKKDERKDTVTYLGKKSQRVEKISLEQATNIARDDQSLQEYKQRQVAAAPPALPSSMETKQKISAQESELGYQFEGAGPEKEENALKPADKNRYQFQVEVAPFQTVSISDNLVYIFRRIGVNNQIYRQGLILQVDRLMHHLTDTYYKGQPLEDFSLLRMERVDIDQKAQFLQAGVNLKNASFTAERIFPSPFEFLTVTIQAENIPTSAVRNSLNAAIVLLGLFLLVGLFVIYKSVHSIVLLSERRSQFVSSVTHELKTPLTNIRMYVEMLQEGIATTQEKEQEYFEILGSESSRLSGLINNVLELARLEKKTRTFTMTRGKLEDVFSEAATLMQEKLSRDGFSLIVEKPDIPEFHYDREVLVQILVNLIENSHKFGKNQQEKKIIVRAVDKKENIDIQVSDTGPGIPKRYLKKVFDDFYRVDDHLTRSTGGTGIGLALVKKFIKAMGGEVAASNNEDGGCTITLSLLNEVTLKNDT